MEKKIELIFPRKNGGVIMKMDIPEGMKLSGLLKTIGANKITAYNDFSGYKNSEELQDHAKYNIFTDSFDRTLSLIKDYKHKN
jgi:hypothetical protein